MKNPYENITSAPNKNSGDVKLMINPYENLIQDPCSMNKKFIDDKKLVQPHSQVMARPVLKSEYRISRLNNVLCLGETYSLVSATEIDVELVKIEYFLLAQGAAGKIAQ